MSFRTDKQTIDDLNIFSRHGRERSIYGLFNNMHTCGGSVVLEEMFNTPFSDPNPINERSSMIGYFQTHEIVFPFRGGLIETIEFYLSNTDNRSKITLEDNTLQRKVRNYLGADTEYEQLHKGVSAVIELFSAVNKFVEDNTVAGIDPSYNKDLEQMRVIAGLGEFAALRKESRKKLSYEKTAAYDKLFRYDSNEKLKLLLGLIYKLDVYISVAAVAKQRGFVSAKALDAGENIIAMENVYHPQLENPVANNIKVDGNNNVVFLTGANMGGKSTFMKTFGVALYLAHMGFPVPASGMIFSVRNGMLTTINLPDNLNLGYSHFYAEVMRVKKVAEWVNRTGNMVVIFDELFRGTNVKDAYDATVAITEAFAENRNCVFMISTHIMEAGDELGRRCKNMHFVYMPTIMNGKVPAYTYKLTSGITNDRHGMIIINNERIIELIDSNNKDHGIQRR